MPSLTAKDRTPLCLFSYEDGRLCRTPRIASHPHFCFYHAKKESQSQAAEKLADDPVNRDRELDNNSAYMVEILLAVGRTADAEKLEQNMLAVAEKHWATTDYVSR